LGRLSKSIARERSKARGGKERPTKAIGSRTIKRRLLTAILGEEGRMSPVFTKGRGGCPVVLKRSQEESETERSEIPWGSKRAN